MYSNTVQLPSGLVTNNSGNLTIEITFQTTDAGILFGYQDAPISTAYTPTPYVAPANFVPGIFINDYGYLEAELYNGKIDPIVSSTRVNDGAVYTAELVVTGNEQQLFLDGQLVGTLGGAVEPMDMTYAQLGDGWTGAIDDNTTPRDVYPNGQPGLDPFVGTIDRVIITNSSTLGGEVDPAPFGADTQFTFTPSALGSYTLSLQAMTSPQSFLTISVGTSTASVPMNVTYAPPTPSITGIPTSSPEGTPVTVTASVTDPSSAIAAGGYVDVWQATDSSGNSVTRNDALEFNGTDDYVDLGNPADLNIAGTITLEAWIKPVDDCVQDITHGYDGDGYTQVYLRIDNGSYQVGSEVDAGNLYASGTMPASDVGQWVFLAGYYDGTEWVLYRDGVEIGSTGITQQGAPEVDNADWTIGANGDGNYFDGAIDDVKIYAINLPAAVLRADSATTPADYTSGLAAYYLFNETSGLTVYDASGNGNNGMLGDGDPADAPTYVPGVTAGPALTFTPPVAGTYTVTLSAIDMYGDTGSTTGTLNVTNVPPTPAIGGLPTSIADGNSVNLTASATEPNAANQAAGFDYVWQVTGAAGQPATSSEALSFNGTNQFVDLSNPTDLDFSGDITLEAWIKPESTYGLQDIIAHCYQLSPSYAEDFLRINNGYYQVGSWDGNNAMAQAVIPAGDVGQWVFLAGVYDGTQWTLYRDGVQIGTSGPTTQGALPVSMTDWSIGAGAVDGDSATRYFSGEIDDVSVWSIGRTSAQVQTDMSAPLNPTQSGLVADYLFDEPAGSLTVVDSTVNQNNGTLGNGDPADAPAHVGGIVLGPKLKFTPPDTGSYAIGLEAIDQLGYAGETFQSLLVTPVAPTVSINGLPAAGTSVAAPVTLTASATDVSPSDTAAGFAYLWQASEPNGTSATSSQALSFNGAYQFVDLGNPADLDISGQITLEAWVNLQSTAGLQDIVAHGYQTSPSYAEDFLRINNGFYQVGSWDGNNAMAQAVIPAGDVGQWVFLAGVYDGEQWVLYRDGVAISTSGTTSQGALPVTAVDWSIGAGAVVNGAGATRFFDGEIDDVSIWDTGLSASQVRSDMAAPLNPSQTGLVADYPFDEGTGDTAVDATSNGNTGTLGGINPGDAPTRVAGIVLAPSVMISPEASGTVTVDLEAYDENGNTAQQSASFSVTSSNPIVFTLPTDTVQAVQGQAFELSGTVSDATGPAPFHLGANFGDGTLGRQSVPVFTITHTYANAGTYTVVLSFNDDAGNTAQTTFQVIVNGFTVNNGAPQQSMVTSLTYVFAGPVQVEPGAFELLRNGRPSDIHLVIDEQPNQQEFLITFRGPGVIGGSLPDGNYTLITLHKKVRVLSGPPMTANDANTFVRLFGDVEGLGVVTAADEALLKHAEADPSTKDAAYFEPTTVSLGSTRPTSPNSTSDTRGGSIRPNVDVAKSSADGPSHLQTHRPAERHPRQPQGGDVGGHNQQSPDNGHNRGAGPDEGTSSLNSCRDALARFIWRAADGIASPLPDFCWSSSPGPS